VSVTFAETTPALPAADVERSIAFYRDILAFEAVHAEEGFAVLRRDAATIHLWGATDDSWRERTDWGRPIVSGAESFLAGTASCRVRVQGVDTLYAQCVEQGIVHPNAHVHDTWWGTREFGILDPDGNLIGLYEERAS
jgi:catechol 2,3-dioxygenase-like lactoylglutathione lyase family enzyme